MASIDRTNKPKRGRPAVDTEPVNLRLPREMLDAIESYRREQPDIPTRPEAIRQMLSDWLQSNGYLPAATEQGIPPEGLNASNDD